MVANRTPGGFSVAQKTTLEEAALIGSSAVGIHLLRHQLDVTEQARAREVRRIAEDSLVASVRLSLATALSSALSGGHGASELLAIASRAVGGVVRVSSANDDLGEVQPGSAVAPLEVGGHVEISDGDPSLAATAVETIATYVSIALLYERAIEDARHLREAELVERLVEPVPPLAGRPLRTGLAGNGSLDVLVAEFRDAPALRTAVAEVRSRLGFRVITASRREKLVAIARSNSGARALIEAALSSSVFFSGVTAAANDTAIPAAFGEASLIARSMRTLHRANEVATRSHLGWWRSPSATLRKMRSGTCRRTSAHCSNRRLAINSSCRPRCTISTARVPWPRSPQNSASMRTRSGSASRSWTTCCPAGDVGIEVSTFTWR